MNFKDQNEAIDFLVTFTGRLSRKELVELAGITNATATRWISDYLSDHPGWLNYEGKTYYPTEQYAFSTLLHNSVEDGLDYICSGTIHRSVKGPVTHSGFLPPILQNNKLNLDLVSGICRAICIGQQLSIIYSSTTSGQTERLIEPHAIFKAGGQWYFRSLSKTSLAEDFRTFRFSRVVSIKEKPFCTNKASGKLKDNEWLSFETLSIRAHPDHRETEALSADLRITKNGVKNFSIRNALIPHFLIENHIDYTIDHSKDPVANPYWLANRENLPGLSFLDDSFSIKIS
jgi:hypothetical protein